MSGRRRKPVGKRYMKLFLVFYWGVAGEAGPDGGIYAVRASNRENCVQLLLREKVSPVPGKYTHDVLDRIRENVFKAKTLRLQGKFQSEKIVEELETRYNDFL